jgi:UDP-N-acetylglucosamine--N-acetylmuramyl-(pentapeptide) pyrophosphoryl-undecaprenol N-acetylglucosamine transferase
MAPFVTRAYLAFPESGRHFRADRTLETGVPIRAGFEARPFEPPVGALELLVLGGSQGARALNETVPAALARLRTPFRAVHQCGACHLADVEQRYRALGIADRVAVSPFIEDVPAALARANLVVGRAGASAVSEICAVGRPSLLVPYPFAGDHQRFNAEALARRGAALCVANRDATPERLVREIEALFAEPAKLARMADAARKLGRPDAALHIARDLLALAGFELTSSGAGTLDSSGNAAPSGPGAPPAGADALRAHASDFVATSRSA